MNKNTNLKKEVGQLLDEVGKTHRYSMSHIYGLWNRVFEKNETPQSCVSCLIRKVHELEGWFASQDQPKMVEKIKTTRKKKADGGKE